MAFNISINTYLCPKANPKHLITLWQKQSTSPVPIGWTASESTIFSRRLREIAEIEAATGRQIVKLAMGSPDLPPHQSVIDRLAKEAQRPDVHKYMSYQGEPILRKGFCRLV